MIPFKRFVASLRQNHGKCQVYQLLMGAIFQAPLAAVISRQSSLYRLRTSIFGICWAVISKELREERVKENKWGLM